MVVGRHLSFSPFNECKARVKTRAFFNQVVPKDELCLQWSCLEAKAASKLRLALMDAAKHAEDHDQEAGPIRANVQFLLFCVLQLFLDRD
ncbi:hypothetical protein Syn8016DRAFT_2942 [Synechococcus sp. WH 8016]|jgi:hypothetical protein|nr:hypothetical protein Syn8016DRAFT_2942 [Synechococcus sp. WH 8016]